MGLLNHWRQFGLSAVSVTTFEARRQPQPTPAQSTDRLYIHISQLPTIYSSLPTKEKKIRST